MNNKLIHVSWCYSNRDENWTCECGLCWQPTFGEPEDNDMRYCPKCGGKIAEFVRINKDIVKQNASAITALQYKQKKMGGK